jgi:hypothetical protein
VTAGVLLTHLGPQNALFGGWGFLESKKNNISIKNKEIKRRRKERKVYFYFPRVSKIWKKKERR